MMNENSSLDDSDHSLYVLLADRALALVQLLVALQAKYVVFARLEYYASAVREADYAAVVIRHLLLAAQHILF